MANAPTFDRGKKAPDDIVEDYFRSLIFDARDVLKSANIKFDFANYTSTIKDFYNLTIDDVGKAWEVSKDIAGWIEYLSDMQSYVQKALNDAETDKKATHGAIAKSYDDKNAARGGRLADQDERVVEARKKRNTLNALSMMLDKKIRALEKMHYFCKATWEINYRASEKPNFDQR